MSDNEMKPCPFCGAGQTEWRNSVMWTGKRNQLLSARIFHWCDKAEGQTHQERRVEVTGKDEDDAIAKWNARAARPALTDEQVREIKLPRHDCSLSIEHNEHRNYYVTAEEHIEELRLTFKDEESRARSIATDEVWTMYWCPDTPIGSYEVSAPTLNELLAFAEEVEKRDKNRAAIREAIGRGERG